MRLCIPQVIGPVSTWNASLLIETALPGASVVIREREPDGRLVASGNAPSGRFRLPLNAGVRLSAGARLFAHQELDGDPSGWTKENLAVLVGAPPTQHADVAPLSIRSRAFVCGQALWVEGAIPGAEVVAAINGTEIGKGIAHEGIARIRLSIRIPEGAPHVEVFQQAPLGKAALDGMPTVTLTPVLSLPVPQRAALPQPTVGPPEPVGCDSILVLYDLIDGAELTIERLEDGSTQSVMTDLEALSVLLDSKLDPRGGQIAVSQSMPERCGYFPSPPKTVDFAQITHLGAPSIVPPCAGSSHLMIDDLYPGAELSIEVNQTVYRAQVGPAVTSQHVELDPLPAEGRLTVQQQKCSVRSPHVIGTVGSAPASTLPVVKGPLYNCARVVRVTNLVPGVLVRIMSSGTGGNWQQLSNPVFARASSMAVGVMPYLVAGQRVWAEQIVCGSGPIQSDRVRVEVIPQIQPVNVTRQLFSTRRFVEVDALPGALVRVYSTSRTHHELIGEGHVDPDNATISLQRPLIERESIGATQQICTVSTEIKSTFGVSPGERTFMLPKEKKFQVPNEPPGKEVIWKSGSLTCRVDGTWIFMVHLENKATKSYANVTTNVTIKGPDLPPIGQSLEFTLAASNNPDDPNNDWLIKKGHLPEQSYTAPALFKPQFLEDETWLKVLSATAVFDWLRPAMMPLSTKPKIDDAKEKKNPPPSA
jgi:hypothetical protein